MKAIDGDKLYKFLDDEEYPEDKYAEVEDILEVIENQPELKAIVIPPNATNGDVIKAIFPNAQIDYHEEYEKLELVDEYVTVFPEDCDTCQDYSYDWWNEEYK
jgi:hypothetical protein